MRKILTLLLMALVLIMPQAYAEGVTVSLTIIAPDGGVLANATVKMISVNGEVFSNTTNASGVVVFNLPSTGLYYVLIHGEGYYVLSVLNVLGNLTTIINASTMPALIVQSTGVSVEYSVVRGEISNVSVKLTTNSTVYTDLGKDVTLIFPGEVVKFPFKYVFEKVVYDNVESTSNSVTFTVTANTTVTAYYSKTLFIVLPTWAWIALGVTVLIAIGLVYVSTKTIKHVVEFLRENSMLFIKRKRFEDYA